MTTLELDKAYYSFGGEVEASTTPTICRLPDLPRHQLSTIALEGGRDPVCELLKSIFRDDRHRDVRILTYNEISERRFQSWTMGQVSLDGVNSALLLKYSESADLNPFNCSGETTMALLDELLATGAVSGRGL